MTRQETKCARCPRIEAEKARAAEVTTEKRPNYDLAPGVLTVSPMNTSVSGYHRAAQAPARKRMLMNCRVVTASAEAAVQKAEPNPATRTTAIRLRRSESGP